MARRHNSCLQSSPQDKSNDGHHHHLESPSSSQRKSPNLTLVPRAMLIRQDMNMSSIQKIKCVLVVVMIVVMMSLLNNIGGQQKQQHLSEQNNANHNYAAETELLQALYDLPLPTTQQELNELNDELAGLEPKFILRWAHTLLAGNNNNLQSQENGWNSHPLVQVTSFGPTGLVVLDHLSKYNLLNNIPVITMDTLHLFQESYTFYDTVQSHYKKSPLHLSVTKPAHIAHPPELNGDSVFKGFISTKAEFQHVYSPTLWKTDPLYYTKVTKLDPLQQKFEEWNAVMWITGRRRSQGGEREEIDVLEFESFPPDETDRRVKSDEDGIGNLFHSSKGRWKLNPLAYWSYEQVWNYIRDNKVPYNPLYDQGYTSIGDKMTTTLPKKSNEGDAIDERSGRFAGLNQTECGLHSHLQKIKALRKQKKDAGEEWTVPELKCHKCIDLNENTFLETVQNINLQDDTSLLLLEFYSPFCGSCQEFAPTLNRVADHQMPNVRVARFDIEQSIPKINNQEVFQVEATPTLYLVRNSPAFHAELYNGKHEYDAILQWLTEKRERKPRY